MVLKSLSIDCRTDKIVQSFTVKLKTMLAINIVIALNILFNFIYALPFFILENVI